MWRASGRKMVLVKKLKKHICSGLFYMAHSVNPRYRDSFTKRSSIQIFVGQLGDKPGDKRLRGKKLVILTILSAKATPELAKCTILSIKRTIGDGKHTIPLETVSKSSAGASKTHDTVNKKSDRRQKTHDSPRDCQQKQRRK